MCKAAQHRCRPDIIQNEARIRPNSELRPCFNLNLPTFLHLCHTQPERPEKQHSKSLSVTCKNTAPHIKPANDAVGQTTHQTLHHTNSIREPCKMNSQTTLAGWFFPEKMCRCDSQCETCFEQPGQQPASPNRRTDSFGRCDHHSS